MNQLVLINAQGNQPILTGEIAVLNKFSEKASSLVSGMKKFLQASFRGVKNEFPETVNETFLKPGYVNMADNATQICCNNLKFKGTFREKICIESELKEIVGSLNTAIAGNFNQFNVVESGDHHLVSANKKALDMVLKNLLYFINERNHYKQVRFEVFEDVDYMVIVAEHRGLHLLRSELMKIYQTSPSRISDPGNALLYTCWHLLRAIGGWLTTGDKDGTNYISIGLPK